MAGQTNFRQFILVFVVTASMVLALRYSRVVEYFSYNVEKGRLRALSESLPSDEQVKTMSMPNRVVAGLVTPGVVHIETTRDVGPIDTGVESDEAAARREFLNDHPWWRRFQREFEEQDNELPFVESGLGSGFVFDAERGFIVTNYHVIEDADTIDAILHDGRRFEASVVGADPESDLAVISIPTDRLHPLEFGDSDALAVGDDVFALGNPFGLDGTFSKGIVSGLGRSNIEIEGVAYQGFIQTDAVINPGNSGGPLVNMRGQVIGVNTAIATDSGGFNGVGFAIPSKRVRQLLPQLVSGQKVVRGFLGVRPMDVRLDRETAEKSGWREPDGIIVTEVDANTPAEAAGIAVGDVIVAIDDVPIRDAAEMMDRIAMYKPGVAIEIVYWRDGARHTMWVTLARRLVGI